MSDRQIMDAREAAKEECADSLRSLANDIFEAGPFGEHNLGVATLLKLHARRWDPHNDEEARPATQ